MDTFQDQHRSMLLHTGKKKWVGRPSQREEKKKQQNKKEINKIKNIQQKDIKLIIKMCTDY